MNLILAFAAVASAVFAFVQAKAATDDRKGAEKARDESRQARDETVALAREANDAFTRQAEAQELANEIELAKRPKPHVDWQPTHGRGRDTRLLVNIGNIAARKVVATGNSGVWTDEDSRADLVEPGDSIEYAVMPATGGSERPRLHVEWDEAGVAERLVWERAVQ